MLQVITNNNFQEVLSGSRVVMVDFWAVWCGPCRMLSPVVDEVADEYEGRLTVAKCNVDDADQISIQCGIRTIPTLLYFLDGQLVDRTVGVVSRSEITSRLDNLLKSLD